VDPEADQDRGVTVIVVPPIVIYLSFFLAIGIASVVVLDWSAERRRLHRTLRGVESAAMSGGTREQQLAMPAMGRVVMPALEGFGRTARRLSPAGVYERVEKELVLAGNPPNWDAERVFAFKMVMPFVTGTLIFLALLMTDTSTLLRVVAVGLFVAAGWYAPEWIVRSRAEERQHEIQMGLADSLDLLSITVEAGLAFDAALSRVARNVKGALGQELYRVVQEIQLGKSRADALRDLADRTSVEDLRGFIAAMVQADAFGIPIARVLKVQSREIRIRRRQRAEEMAQKLPVKIVFPVVLTIFPALFVVLLGPAAIQIYQTIIQGGAFG
jgi:tight adherence protein C